MRYGLSASENQLARREMDAFWGQGVGEGGAAWGLGSLAGISHHTCVQGAQKPSKRSF